jgi:pyruvate dehydrogenase (quinone)
MYQLPVTVIVFNNSALRMVKLEMLVDRLPDYQTDNGGFDYAAIARAVGMHGIRVDEPTDVRVALKDALAHPGPALVDLATDPNALSIAPHFTAAQVTGFALAAGKTVLDGGVGNMLEMARANLRNIPRPRIAR